MDVFADEASGAVTRLEITFAGHWLLLEGGRLSTGERLSTFDREGGLAFLDESLAAIDAMEEAMRAAMRVYPEARFPALARAATGHLQRAGRWPVAPDPQTGVPPNAAPTLYLLWREAGGDAAGG